MADDSLNERLANVAEAVPSANQYLEQVTHLANRDCLDVLLACPRCKGPLRRVGPDKLMCANRAGCPRAGTIFPRSAGIWRFLLPERAAHYAQFSRDYEHIRRMEGRGSTDTAYYLSLPYAPAGSPFHSDWRMRARSYRTFLEQILEPRERNAARPLHILDLGAGNGWLSNRLSQRDHCLTAVDLIVNPLDGLGAYIYYDRPFLPVQAEFEYLPLAEVQYDLAVFNASLHYAERYAPSLAVALRVLKPGGGLVIMDTPFYRRQASGEQMVRERASQFKRDFGTASDSLMSENFLTFTRLAELGEALDLRWEMVYPHYRLRDTIRRRISGWRAGREPARFPIVWAVKPALTGERV